MWGFDTAMVFDLQPGSTLLLKTALAHVEASITLTQLLDILHDLSGLLPPVIHRDIKPSNVVIDDDGRCALVDFGSVRDAVETSRTGGSTVAGPLSGRASAVFLPRC